MCLTMVFMPQRDRSRAFHEQGKANADKAVAELMSTPEFKEWKRKKEALQKWMLFDWVKRAAGVLLLAGLGVYAAHLNGWFTLPSGAKIEF